MRAATAPHRGFTLIELLVVIAIIAILAAILFPVFAQARDKARQTACLSNMKQIGSAVAMYTQDYDEMMPTFYLWYYGPANTTRAYGMYEGMAPYVKNVDVYVCPSFKFNSTQYRPGMPNPSGFFGRTFTASYTGILSLSHFNNAAGATSVWRYNGNGVKLGEVPHPVDTVVMVESNHMLVDNNGTAQANGTVVGGAGIGYYGFYEDGRPVPLTGTGLAGRMHYRHAKRMNVAFLDGHAKSTKQFSRISELAIR